MVPIAKRQIVSAGIVYNRGCPVEPARLPNFERLVQAGCIEWRLPTSVGPVKPVAVATPTPEPPRPAIYIDRDAVDPVVRWQNSLAEMVKRYGGDYGRAKNALECDRDGAELFKLATRSLAERNAIKGGTVARRIAAL
jgi:hypothetical protein